MGGLGSQAHLSQVDEMKQAPFTMGMAMPSLSLYHHPKACMSHSFLLRGRVQQYLPTKVPGKVPSGHWFTDLGT